MKKTAKLAIKKVTLLVLDEPTLNGIAGGVVTAGGVVCTNTAKCTMATCVTFCPHFCN